MDNAPEEKAAAPAVEQKHYADILRSLMGKTVTVANPESYEDAPIGHTIKVGFYRAKVTGGGLDYLVIMTEYKHAGKTGGVEPVKQFIPFTDVNRVSVLKQEIILHL
ncbi:MAG: hypothetical protein ABFS86_06850 [Planctomycetota bacterium]